MKQASRLARLGASQAHLPGGLGDGEQADPGLTQSLALLPQLRRVAPSGFTVLVALLVA